MFYLRFFALWSVLLLAGCVYTQTPPPPAREFRGVWVATVSNIDYPKKPDTRPVALREQWIQLLEHYKRMGMNAVVVQIRPAGDALYPTALAPWSAFLTGRQGQAPSDPEFDPLAFMIQETHRMGMDFHAWMNPYRATVNLDTASLHPSHAFYAHRPWLIRYGSRFYFNPALPEVRSHINEVITEVVEKYDVDAIHFDDYFYPYKEEGLVFPDSADYRLYGGGFWSIDDWRRSNVDSLILMVSKSIREIKPHVQFGISPFGIWRTVHQDPVMGADVRPGTSCYDDLYADVLKWSRLGWIDYLAPQLYWHIGFDLADHAKLLAWWEKYHYDRLLYIGHGAYKVGRNQETAWHDPREIPRQIELNRRSPAADGSVFFSSKSLIENPLGVRDSLVTQYRNPALLPALPRPTDTLRQQPRLLPLRDKGLQPFLQWHPNRLDRKSPPHYYALYRFEGNRLGDFEDARNLLWVSARGEFRKKFSFHDTTVIPDRSYTYAVVALNRSHSFSKPSVARTVYTGKEQLVIKK